VEKAKRGRKYKKIEGMEEGDEEGIEVEEAREAGSEYVGHKMWQKLNMDDILQKCGIRKKARMITEMMVMNRFISPSSELAMPEWINRTALGDILNVRTDKLNEGILYRTMDKIYPAIEQIEGMLARHEESLFNLDTSIYLPDTIASSSMNKLVNLLS